MDTKYLKTEIVETKFSPSPRYGFTRLGCTVKGGAPTSIMVRLDGETRWRRLMVWSFSNVSTCFLRIKGEAFVVHEHKFPEVKNEV